MSVRLYVGNLPFSVTEQDLEEIFAQVGTVESTNIVTDRDTGRSRGFAFVEMDTQEAADAAIQNFNGRELEGRSLTVNEARPRESRPPRSGGFGGGGDAAVDRAQHRGDQQHHRDQVARFAQLLAERQARKAAAQAAAHDPCVTKDGVRIEVFANTGSLNDALAALANGAEGSGLLRTEFLFLDRETPPDENEQARQYQAIASALEGKPLIIRTLDVGGDKAAPYLPIPAEENPALGLRGVRVSLWRPHLLKTQLRAILRVRPLGQCKIMVPMIASLDELRAVRAVLDEAKREMGVADKVELGVMIETPAAAIMVNNFLKQVDFISVGTNDLIQFTLAVDRSDDMVAHLYDPTHPAILYLLSQTFRAADRIGVPVSRSGRQCPAAASVPAVTLPAPYSALRLSARASARARNAAMPAAFPTTASDTSAGNPASAASSGPRPLRS